MITNDGNYRGRLVEMSFETVVLEDAGGMLRAWPPEAVVTLTPAPP
jgi:hypothetical protein